MKILVLKRSILLIDIIKDIDYVKRYYGYSNEKAKQALTILTKEQLAFIKSKFETGGTK